MNENIIKQFQEVFKPTFNGKPHKKDFIALNHDVGDVLFLINSLNIAEKEMNLTEIARELKITKAALSQKINKLSFQGLIQRYSKDNDRKNAYIKLTSKGKEIFDNWNRNLNLIIEKIVNEVGEEEVSKLVETVKKIRKVIMEIKEEITLC
ncbi:MAG: MarR family transcriptional regulator [Bacillales bacterium]|jgi:DNA-binding MarR family transcriptional regulator|nr:MarR family transcriptional regulator [Bacillales bacterium]